MALKRTKGKMKLTVLEEYQIITEKRLNMQVRDVLQFFLLNFGKLI